MATSASDGDPHLQTGRGRRFDDETRLRFAHAVILANSAIGTVVQSKSGQAIKKQTKAKAGSVRRTAAIRSAMRSPGIAFRSFDTTVAVAVSQIIMINAKLSGNGACRFMPSF